MVNRMVAALTAVVCLGSHVTAEEPDPLTPRHCDSIMDIIAFTKFDRLMAGKKASKITGESFERMGRKLYLTWYYPGTGFAKCKVFTYTFNEKEKRWDFLRQQLFDDTFDVSAVLPEDMRLVIRDEKGKQIYREPEANGKLPELKKEKTP